MKKLPVIYDNLQIGKNWVILPGRDVINRYEIGEEIRLGDTRHTSLIDHMLLTSIRLIPEYVIEKHHHPRCREGWASTVKEIDRSGENYDPVTCISFIVWPKLQKKYKAAYEEEDRRGRSTCLNQN
jgi:hypothetical protein